MQSMIRLWLKLNAQRDKSVRVNNDFISWGKNENGTQSLQSVTLYLEKRLSAIKNTRQININNTLPLLGCHFFHGCRSENPNVDRIDKF
jgi:hypothetical protein